MEFLERKQDFSEITHKISNLINTDQALKDLKKQNFSPNQHELFYLDKAPTNLYVPYLLFRNKFRVLTEGKIKTDFPLYLLIEPTSICNLRCVMCFQTDKSFGADKSFMGRMNI